MRRKGSKDAYRRRRWSDDRVAVARRFVVLLLVDLVVELLFLDVE